MSKYGAIPVQTYKFVMVGLVYCYIISIIQHHHSYRNTFFQVRLEILPLQV